MALEGYDSSDGDNCDILVTDESSPLLLTLDPPGTRKNYVEGNRGRMKDKSALSFKAGRTKRQGLPWIIVFTAFGMATMVLIGFITMFQDTASVDGPPIVAVDISDSLNDTNGDKEKKTGPVPIKTLEPMIGRSRSLKGNQSQVTINNDDAFKVTIPHSSNSSPGSNVTV